MKRVLSALLVLTMIVFTVIAIGLYRDQHAVYVNTDLVSGAASSTEQEQTQEIKITLENWADYFEIVQEDTWEENAFGEAEALYIDQIIRPKDEYASRIDATNTNVAFEIAAYKTLENIDIDFENRTYSFLGSRIENYSGEITCDGTILGTDYYLFSCGNGYSTIDEEKVSNIEILSDVSMLRVKGSLFLYQ